MTETMPADPTMTAESTKTSAPAESGTVANAASGLRYGEALEELEGLLDDLEDADIDIDHLAERVARGVELVRFCRDRLAVVTGDVDQVVADNPEQVEQFRAGKEKVLGFFVGQIMKATKGQADGKVVNQLLSSKAAG